MQTPAILHWDLNHFVVLRSIGAKSAIVPRPGRRRAHAALAELSKHFTGVVLELTPAAGFRPVEAEAPMRLSSLWSRMTGMANALLQVIVLSALAADRRLRHAVSDPTRGRRGGLS